MLEYFLLVLLLVFVFRFFAAALRQQGPAPAMGDQGNVIAIHSTAEWNAKLEEAGNKTIVVDFTATWCGPCRHMAPVFVELSKKYPSLVFLKVDVDQVTEVAGLWDVQAMPTFIFIKNKKLVHKIVGANKDELEKKSLAFSSQPS
ncbi:thioredoxin [Marchantia polymorpha subsp. ruderalis]|uniref:Thioredoxin domain-containing protein n=3 Tax=Marchantia polymorpha TaxID=3197 RepID=A0AAF6AXI0_MARPO|nr:hypothetical protein MARPO_0022s0042 [Marchantia polymorpha]BBN04464.1 hypothetical protein Mp_3g04870 [Marchantia polymorpha subsp. ruderalis]|eukprot:PTQ43938.1 hypothetical protein MARPO_0022s0042 [Marchantia polymorpha]